MGGNQHVAKTFFIISISDLSLNTVVDLIKKRPETGEDLHLLIYDNFCTHLF